MSDVTLKPLHEQVIVMTGGSSGIGLCTARMAADRGARLVLAARNETVQRKIVDEINQRAPDRAIAVIADVSKQEDVQRIADEAIKHFGGFDTWVNNAAVSIYGPIMDVSIEDHRRLFE